MAEFKLKLEEAYSISRREIDNGASDEELVANPEYRRCLLIYNVLSTLFGSEDGYEWGEATVELDDYDIEKFLKRYSLDIVRGETGYQINFTYNDERENSDRVENAE